VNLPALVPPPKAEALPALIASAGPAVGFAFDEFFTGRLRNPRTRAAYRLAVCRFLDWVKAQEMPLERITPGMVGTYFDRHPGSPPTRKLHLAALRAFFDVLVTRHVLILNPAASVRGERYQVIEGKTPEITLDQARTLLLAINTGKAVGLRCPSGQPRGGLNGLYAHGWPDGHQLVAWRSRTCLGLLLWRRFQGCAGAKAAVERKALTRPGRPPLAAVG
jgi:hypothetical protein